MLIMAFQVCMFVFCCFVVVFFFGGGGGGGGGKYLFYLQDSGLAECNFFLNRSLFCQTVLLFIVILTIFAGHLSDMNFSAGHQEWLILSIRITLF